MCGALRLATAIKRLDEAVGDASAAQRWVHDGLMRIHILFNLVYSYAFINCVTSPEMLAWC